MYTAMPMDHPAIGARMVRVEGATLAGPLHVDEALPRRMPTRSLFHSIDRGDVGVIQRRQYLPPAHH